MPETPAEPAPRRRFDRSSPVVWAAAALLALLLFNAVVNPGFFSLRIQDGHLFGSPVDVLKNAAPTLLIAVGMTLVIATRGIDLSVGAVLAISGSVAFTIIEGSSDPTSAGTAAVAIGSIGRRWPWPPASPRCWGATARAAPPPCARSWA